MRTDAVRLITQSLIATLVLVVSAVTPGAAQAPAHRAAKKGNKGRLYFFWGWNRAAYTHSDLTFTGADYDFKLSSVSAHDAPSTFSLGAYFGKDFTIPQSNFRIGYFLSDHWDLAIGFDHMKYVMDQNQTAAITGRIANSGTAFDGVYNGEDIVLSPDFLTYENTDGLNYVFAEFSRSDGIFTKSLANVSWLRFDVTEGIGAGVLYPKTNTMILGQPRHDRFHVSGYGASLKAGLRTVLFGFFLIQTEVRGGFIDMPDIRTTFDPVDRAKQSFWFIQGNLMFGGAIGIATN